MQQSEMKIPDIEWGKRRMILGRRTLIMGILNVTPDSFSDGGKFFNFDDAVAQGEKMFREGADILDIGGESTRPFSDPVTVKEEMGRVIPVIEKLSSRISIPISIDTTRSVVAEKALKAGAEIINDVSSFRVDPNMADLASSSGVPIILMHMLGTPKTMQVNPEYNDLFGEIKNFLENAVDFALSKGIDRSKLIIDPGIGFGKTVAHNLLLIKYLDKFKNLNLPILIGPSRKMFIRNILKDKHVKDILPDLPEVEVGTQAAVAAAVLNGAHIVRVHNVANSLITVKIIDAIKNAPNG